MARIRIRFAKVGKIRWTSHRDTARMWERAFRRVSLPLVWSNGFSPRPKVSFGLALPTGYESVAEYLDLELAASAGSSEFDVTALPATLSAALPHGVDALAASVIDDRAPSLQEEVSSCTWRLAIVPRDESNGSNGLNGLAEPELAARLQRILDADSVVVTRKRKGVDVTDDIRPGILSLGTVDAGWVECQLTSQPRSLRPSELVAALGPDVEERHVRRTHQWIERDGAPREPLALPSAATTAPHAMERAS